MKIDLEYISSILDVFLEAETAHIDLSYLEKSGINLSGELNSFEERFMFHMQIAIDNQLVGTQKGNAYNLKDIGVNQSQSGRGLIINTPIRLTQKGHDFASTLNNKEVLAKLKSELKDAPFKVIFEGGQKLIQHAMKKKLDNLLA
ncbi:MAG: hypothetical protein ACJAW8_000608 [Oleispira sp.]